MLAMVICRLSMLSVRIRRLMIRTLTIRVRCKYRSRLWWLTMKGKLSVLRRWVTCRLSSMLRLPKMVVAWIRIMRLMLITLRCRCRILRFYWRLVTIRIRPTGRMFGRRRINWLILKRCMWVCCRLGLGRRRKLSKGRPRAPFRCRLRLCRRRRTGRNWRARVRLVRLCRRLCWRWRMVLRLRLVLSRTLVLCRRSLRRPVRLTMWRTRRCGLNRRRSKGRILMW